MSKPFANVRDEIWDAMSVAIPKVIMQSVAGGRYDVGKVTYRLSIDMTFDRDFEKKIFASSSGRGVAFVIENVARLGLKMFFADEESTASNLANGSTSSPASILQREQQHHG
jgi:hypothetical protein